MLFRSAKELDPALIPDDLTIPQFILGAHTDSNRPTRDARADTWLVQDKTGRRIGLDELKRRTDGLANALSLQYGVKADDVGEQNWDSSPDMSTDTRALLQYCYSPRITSVGRNHHLSFSKLTYRPSEIFLWSYGLPIASAPSSPHPSSSRT